MTKAAKHLDELDALLAGATGGKWRSGRADTISGLMDGTRFKNIYVDDPRGGTHHSGVALPLVIARALDEPSTIPDAQSVSDEEILANAALIAALKNDAPALIACARAADRLLRCDPEHVEQAERELRAALNLLGAK